MKSPTSKRNGWPENNATSLRERFEVVRIGESFRYDGRLWVKKNKDNAKTGRTWMAFHPNVEVEKA